MAARTLPTLPTFAANSELTSAQLTQITTYQSFWANPPMFRAEQHSVQSVASGTPTQVTCETVIHDSDSGLAVATPFSYVIPFAGIWDLAGGVGFTGAATGVRLAMIFLNGGAINGSENEYAPCPNSSNYLTNAPGTSCNVGDVIALYCEQTTGSALSTVTSGLASWFTGKLVSLNTP
ncbi:hypothetical protein [Streptacidiphilus rugosus]|uniref:hypothetical protein n=1 Tax=Streptacidiphilus rugosus TaxID=405783 RepID=UPI0005691DBF|nr:hypothetical protein [Streptacidiphilus rugosus]